MTTVDQSVSAQDSARRRPSSERELAVLPAPSPEMVHAARARLASRFTTGVDALLWETMRQPMRDVQAIGTVLAIEADRDDATAGALDFGAALIVLAALRLDIDRLEADLMDAVTEVGLDWDFIATALGIPVPQAMKRHRVLGPRRTIAVDHVPPPALAGDDLAARPAAG